MRIEKFRESNLSYALPLFLSAKAVQSLIIAIETRNSADSNGVLNDSFEKFKKLAGDSLSKKIGLSIVQILGIGSGVGILILPISVHFISKLKNKEIKEFEIPSREVYFRRRFNRSEEITVGKKSVLFKEEKLEEKFFDNRTEQKNGHRKKIRYLKSTHSVTSYGSELGKRYDKL